MTRSLLALLIASFGLGSSFAQSVTVRVDGDGYLRFVADGRMQYAKTAKLTVVSGRLTAPNGAKLVPAVSIGAPGEIKVDLEGQIQLGGQTVGQIVLALFANPIQLNADGFGSSSLRPSLGNPGEGANGVIRVVGDKPTVTAPVTKPKPVANKPTTGAPVQTPGGAASLAADTPAKTTAKPSIQIVFPDRAEVETDSFTIGQVANVVASTSDAARIAQIELGDTPPIGIDRIIDRNRVNYRLKAVGFDPDRVSIVGPDKIHVTRKGQKVANAQFVDCAVKGAQIKGTVGEIEALTPGPDMTVPLGEVQLVCESVTGSGAEPTAMVGVYVDGKRFNSRLIRLKATGPTISLKPGTIVTVRVVSRSVSVQSKGKVVRIDQSTGQIIVQVTDTGAQLAGILKPDGTVEVQA